MVILSLSSTPRHKQSNVDTINTTINTLRGSRFTVMLSLWLVFILCNTFIGRQIQRFLLSSGGKELILASISMVAVCALLLLARELVKAQLSLRLKPLVVLLLMAVLAAVMMPILEETLHIVKYGGLGFFGPGFGAHPGCLKSPGHHLCHCNFHI